MAVGTFLRCLSDCVACRVPPRRAGNFHLGGQMKVTKAKALNATPFITFCTLRRRARRAIGHPCCTAAPQRTRRRGRRWGAPAQDNNPLDTRPTRSEARPARWRHDPQRSLRRPAGRGSAACRTHRGVLRWPLCFGDFHLGPQMKVTRPPGRDPAGWRTTNPGHERLESEGPQPAASRLRQASRVSDAMDH